MCKYAPLWQRLFSRDPGPVPPLDHPNRIRLRIHRKTKYWCRVAGCLAAPGSPFGWANLGGCFAWGSWVVQSLKGLGFSLITHPALKRWAILCRPANHPIARNNGAQWGPRRRGTGFVAMRKPQRNYFS